MVENVTGVPNAAHFVDGVVFSRGQVVPALNLRARFGFERADYDLRTRLLVVQHGGRQRRARRRRGPRVPGDPAVRDPAAASLAFLREHAADGGGALDDHEIRELLSGNLCRCTGYTSIVEGVKVALGNGAGSTPLPHEG